MPRKLSASELMKDFRAGLDDTALMAKYGLSSPQLESVLKKLRDRGILSAGDLEQRPSKGRKVLEIVGRDSGNRIFGGHYGSLGDLLSAAMKSNTFLGGVDLRSARLAEARLSGIRLPRADLRQADLSRADLADADLSEADLSGAGLWKTDLRDVDFTGAVLVAADFQGADLAGANFTGANLTGANLHKANLALADFTGADLTNANLSYSNLQGANLSGTQRQGTNLEGIGAVDIQYDRVASEKREKWREINEILGRPIGLVGVQAFLLVVQTLLFFSIGEYMIHFTAAIALVNVLLWRSYSHAWIAGIVLQALYPALLWKLFGK